MPGRPYRGSHMASGDADGVLAEEVAGPRDWDGGVERLQRT